MPGGKGKKKSFVLRMDPETFRVLEQWAADEFRSLNGQIEFLLHQAMVKARRNKKVRPSGDGGDGDTDLASDKDKPEGNP